MIPAFREPIHILGSGSIGLLFASSIRFKFPTFPVTLLVRDRHRHHFEKQKQMPSATTSASDRFTSPASSTSKSTSKSGSFSSYPNTKILKERFRHDDEVFVPHFVHQQPPHDHDDNPQPVMRVSWEQHIDPSSIVHSGRHSRRQYPFHHYNEDDDDCLLPPALASKNNNQFVSVPVEFVQDDHSEGYHNYKYTSSSSPIYNLIVATKSYQAKDAVENVLQRLLSQQPLPLNVQKLQQQQQQRRRIVVLCNGALAVKDELETLLRNTKQAVLDNTKQDSPFTSPKTAMVSAIENVDIVLATTTHGVYQRNVTSSPTYINDTTNTEAEDDVDVGLDKLNMNNTRADEATHRHLVHAGIGKTFIEEEMKHAHGGSLGELFCQVGLNCTVLSSSEMEELLWKKLAANCVINPLTALCQCTNGELLLEPTFPSTQQAVLSEIASLMGAIQKSQRSHDLDINSNEEDRESRFESLLQFVSQVIEDTKNNYSSLHQDIFNRQQKTEISHLNGYVVQKGKEFGVDCPTNEDLMMRVLELEKLQIQHQQYQSQQSYRDTVEASTNGQ